MTGDYVRTSAAVLALCSAKDPTFPNASDSVILAWAEDLEYYKIGREDALDAVRKLYRENTDPGFRPTPGLLCMTARGIRRERIDGVPELYGPEKLSYAEFRTRHPEVQFPKLGKEIS